jgi:hypothetical protein
MAAEPHAEDARRTIATFDVVLADNHPPVLVDDPGAQRPDRRLAAHRAEAIRGRAWQGGSPGTDMAMRHSVGP